MENVERAIVQNVVCCVELLDHPTHVLRVINSDCVLPTLCHDNRVAMPLMRYIHGDGRESTLHTIRRTIDILFDVVTLYVVSKPDTWPSLREQILTYAESFTKGLKLLSQSYELDVSVKVTTSNLTRKWQRIVAKCNASMVSTRKSVTIRRSLDRLSSSAGAVPRSQPIEIMPPRTSHHQHHHDNDKFMTINLDEDSVDAEKEEEKLSATTINTNNNNSTEKVEEYPPTKVVTHKNAATLTALPSLNHVEGFNVGDTNVDDKATGKKKKNKKK